MKKIVLAAGLTGVALMTMGAKGCGSSTPSASSPAASSPTIAPVASTAPTTKKAPAVTAPAAAKTLLDVTGTGDKTTEPFTASGAWHLAYSYDCANFGYAGNFVVEVKGGDGFSDQGPSTQGKSGQDTNYEPQGGTYSLEVISECQWHVVVTG